MRKLSLIAAMVAGLGTAQGRGDCEASRGHLSDGQRPLRGSQKTAEAAKICSERRGEGPSIQQQQKQPEARRGQNPAAVSQNAQALRLRS